MKIEFHIKDIVITANQKSLIEKRLAKLKRYVKDEPMIIDVYLTDESSAEKGGIDQSVELSGIFSGEKIFVKEIDDRLMRAFAFAYSSFERQLERFHRKRIDKMGKGSATAVGRLLRRLRIRE